VGDSQIRYVDRNDEHWRPADDTDFGRNWLVCEETDRGARYLPSVEKEFGPLAVQLTSENGPQVWEWADSKPYYEPDKTISGLTVFTPAGRVKAEFGDWIIRTTGGAFHVRKDGEGVGPGQFCQRHFSWLCQAGQGQCQRRTAELEGTNARAYL
jgi:hypothetical protein